MPAVAAFAVPLACALAAALAAMIAEAFGRVTLSRVAAAAGLLGAAIAAGFAAASTPPQVAWHGFAVGAGYSTVVVLVYVLGALAVAATLGSWSEEGGDARGLGSGESFAALVALGSAACALLGSSTDPVMMLISLEVVAAVGYALVAQGSSARSHEAAMKYFVQGAVATALYVMGLAVVLVAGAFVVASGGLVSAERGVDVAAASIGVVFLLGAFSFKLGAFPFHSWAPDAYETAPPPGAAFLSSAPKVAALAALFTLFFSVMPAGGLTVRMTWFIALVAGGSVVFGNLAALRQANFGRMLAYSGIAQAGYALTALVVRNGSLGVMYASAYALAVAGLFIGAAAVRSIRPEWDGSIAGLAGLGRVAPVLSAAMAVCLFSLTGIPPLFGFWGKFLVFMNAAADPTWRWLVFVGLIGSAVSFGYYGRVLRAIYFDGADAAVTPGLGEPPGAEVPAPSTYVESVDFGARPGRGGAATWVAVVLAAVVVFAGVVPLVWGFGRFAGLEPAGLFVLSLVFN